MTHILIVGMTESGKTTLAKQLCARYKEKGINTIVLDPMHDPGWNANFQTADQFEFLNAVKASRQCALFIDESGDVIGRYNDTMFWLATKARHFGHKSHFITQRAAQLNPTVRTQCSTLFAFNMGLDDAITLSREFNKSELKTANSLKQLECFFTTRFGDMKKITIKH